MYQGQLIFSVYFICIDSHIYSYMNLFYLEIIAPINSFKENFWWVYLMFLMKKKIKSVSFIYNQCVHNVSKY